MKSLTIIQVGFRLHQLGKVINYLYHKFTLIALLVQNINKLVSEFDLDGISDRQLVYKRTIDFVDSRFNFLYEELNEIENKKQNFK